MMTGTMYFTAMRDASTAAQKQSLGVAGAMMGIGASELRPNSACKRSALLGFVGKPVDGPPRRMSQITNGIFPATAKPSASLFKAIPRPGRAVEVIAPA